ncbi:hypothetical protein WDU94_015480 [Cyamophila willieti]
MCLMKAMHNFIASHTFDEMSVFTEQDNWNFLRTHFENRIDEMNGIIKLAQGRQVQNRNPNVVRETFDLMKRLLLAYVDGKIGHVFIINMNVAPDIQFMYRVCLSLYEPLKINLENEKAELEKQMILDYIKSSGLITPQIEEEVTNIKEIEKESVKHIENVTMRLPSKLRSECLVKMEPFKVVWEEFLKTKPGLKFTLDFYLKDLNTMENKLEQTEDMLTNEKFDGNLKDHEREDLISESETLERQITLTRKKIIQTQYDYQPQFNEFCTENDYVALPDDIDFIDESKYSVTINLCSKEKSEALNNLNLESFYNYLDQMIKNSELATIVTVENTKESQRT